MTSDLDALRAAVLADTTGDRRGVCMLVDEMQARGCWDEASVLAFVCEHKASDGPRLLAAEWYDANGQEERAEFIRVQCEYAKAPEFIERTERLNPGAAGEWSADCPIQLPPPTDGDCCPGGVFSHLVLTWDAPNPRRVELEARERALLLLVPPYPLPPGFVADGNLLARCSFREPSHGLPGAGVYWAGTFRRGFVAEVTCPAASWLTHRAAITAAHPIEVVALTTRPNGTVEWRQSDATVLAWLNHFDPGVRFQLPSQMHAELV